jgi:hypothetical protein
MTGMSARLFSQALSALSDDRIDWIEPVTVTIDVVDKILKNVDIKVQKNKSKFDKFRNILQLLLTLRSR